MKIYIWGIVLGCTLSVIHAQPICHTNYLSIYTGYDENTNSAFSDSSLSMADGSWIITSDEDSGTNEPRPAYAITKQTGWIAPMQNTQWISSYPDPLNNITGNYSFVFKFCLESDFLLPQLHLDIRSDNKAYVYLNGHFVDSTLTNSSFGNTIPVSMFTDNASFFLPGQNELKVLNHNEGSIKGINVSGYVSTESYSILTNDCCAPSSFISGYKWNDMNGNGIKDSPEPVLSGWEIHLSNGQTAITDNHGYYFFSGLPPGNYTVTEVQKPGWVATYPAPGNHVITLLPQEVKDGNNFGNHLNPCHERIIVDIDTLCAGKPTHFTASYASPQAPNYTWSFGDGQTGTGTSLSHIYINPGVYSLTVTALAGICSATTTIEVVISPCIPCEECIGSFAPLPGEKYVLSAWVKEANSVGKTTYSGPAVLLTFEPSFTLPPMKAEGLIIDGWQRIEKEFTVPGNANAIRVKLMNTGTNEVFFDDIRIDPFQAGTKSFVYDPTTLRLMAELDERNYATFYEYDSEGALIRVKKETERGIKTIKESGNNTQTKY